MTGGKLKVQEERAPSNVVNLMDALRQSVKKGRSGRRKSARTQRRPAKKAGRSQARTHAGARKAS